MDEVNQQQTDITADAFEQLAIESVDHSNGLYIIDTSVADYQTLIDEVPDGAQVELFSPEDGLSSISSILAEAE